HRQARRQLLRGGDAGTEGIVRSFSAGRLLVIDEAARVEGGLFASVRPMLAVSRGRLVALSSAWAKQGWFFEAWTGKADWHRVKVTAARCPPISPEFLAEELEAIGRPPLWPPSGPRSMT